MTDRYRLAAAQPRSRSIFAADGSVRRDLLDANVDHLATLIARAAGEHGATLVVLPQFALTGYAANADWLGASLAFPGPALDRLAEAARAAGAWVAVHGTEVHDAFPGRYFNSAALLDDAGEVRLVYRKHYTLTAGARPIDLLGRFVDAFGADALFPVVDTPLGRIGITIANEIFFPEATRSLARKGVELILNPTAAAPALDYLGRPGVASLRAARAFENVAWLAMANIGAFADADGRDTTEPAPPSTIFDHRGAVAAEGSGAPDSFALATVDLAALREARARPGANLVAQIQPGIHADPAGDAMLWPADAFAERPPQGFEELLAIERAIGERLVRR